MAEYESPLSYEEALLRVNALQHSISDLKSENQRLLEENKELYKAAHYDALTGIYNLAGYERSVKHALDKLSPGLKISYVVAYGDVGGLKWVNDRYTHTFGDTLLLIVVLMIRRSVKASDTIARIGGDEIIICVRGDKTAAAAMLNRISDLLFTFTMGIVQIHFGVASGEVSSWADVKAVERNAEEQMYLVKAAAKRPGARLKRWWKGVCWLTRASYEQLWSR